MKILKIIFCAVLVIAVAVISIRLFSKGNVFKMTSSAMVPAIGKGEYVLIDKDVYKNGQPKRGDMVIYIFPPDPKKRFVHRISGLPSETIEIKDIGVFVDGTALTEPQFSKMFHSMGKFAKEGSPMKIAPDCYFVLGDNSSDSYDSRFWGCLPKNNIIGRVARQ